MTFPRMRPKYTPKDRPGPDADAFDGVLDVVAERIAQDLECSLRTCCDCPGKFTGPGPRCPACVTARDGERGSNGPRKDRARDTS